MPKESQNKQKRMVAIMKRFLYASGITLFLMYLLGQFSLLHMESTNHLNILFLVSLFVLITSGCIHVARTSFWKIFMHGWKRVGRVVFRKPFSMQEVDEVIHSDEAFVQWKKRMTDHLMVYALGSGTALFVVATVLSFNL